MSYDKQRDSERRAMPEQFGKLRWNARRAVAIDVVSRVTSVDQNGPVSKFDENRVAVPGLTHIEQVDLHGARIGIASHRRLAHWRLQEKSKSARPPVDERS